MALMGPGQTEAKAGSMVPEKLEGVAEMVGLEVIATDYRL